MSEPAPQRSHLIGPGDRIGPYRIVAQLGSGGMGAVFEAIHEAIECRVAVKVLHAAHAHSAAAATRLMNEARAVNRIEHPGIVRIHDCGQLPDGTVYIVMELLRGETLTARFKRQQVSLAQSVRIARQVASTLAAAHEKGIVHRDLKPDNVMIVADAEAGGGERAKLLDFGIAQLQTEGEGTAAGTAPGSVLGTPLYMAPEQCSGTRITDARCDVYALGVMLYWMLSGQTPFQGSVIDVIAAHLFSRPRPIAELVPLPVPLSELVHQLLHKDPQQRPRMVEVAASLEQVELQISSTERAEIRLAPSSRTGTGADLVVAEPSESLIAKRPRRWMRHGAALFLVLCAVVLLWFAEKRPSGQRPVANIPLTTTSQPSVVTPATVVTAPAQPSAPVAPHPLIGATQLVQWEIRSEPVGALVRLAANNQILGQTPLLFSQPKAEGTSAIFVELPGYVAQQLQLSLAVDQSQRITLRKQVGSARRLGRGPGSSRTSPRVSPSHKEQHDSPSTFEMEE